MSKLSERQREDLLAIAAQRDDDIDLSDIPEIRELPPDYVVGFANRPRKVNVTIPLDSDIAAWLEASGEGGQREVNHHLRQLMRQSIRP